jgi:hypothetical protein
MIRTFHHETREMELKINNSRKKNLHVQYKLLCHPNRVKILAIAEVS